ncbi:MAG: MotA/TolQ/ExbB proton channel family protein [Gemmatimonadetes bacterium]|nr:MotA/TolQ/ExbB proton channel family protein [Gemmatimonadota bacterium]
MEGSILGMWATMGIFAKGVAVTLILMSVASLSIAVSKWIRFRRMSNATRRFANPFSEALGEGRIEDALDLAKKHKRSHVAQVLGESLREVAPRLGDAAGVSAAIPTVERAIEREQILLAHDLRYGMGLMATVASTAPFVGLLGTTVGIITAFQGMAASGGGLEAISAGIAEALVTTAIGLIVAISAVWLYNYFTGRVEVLFSELAYAGREFVDFLISKEKSGVTMAGRK